MSNESNGVEFYRGPSEIDGTTIVAIATGLTKSSNNIKTGAMIQTWFMSTLFNPIEAIKQNADRAICGECKHRGSSCYVNIAQAPLNIWKAWKKGKYPRVTDLDWMEGKVVRVGSYGDICALPRVLALQMSQKAKCFTCYTHAWQNPKFDYLKPIAMASVDNEAEYKLATKLGWRTFRIKHKDEEKFDNEIACPASEEAGKKTTCEKCLLCNGNGKDRKPNSPKSVVINIHGPKFKIKKFGELEHKKDLLNNRISLL